MLTLDLATARIMALTQLVNVAQARLDEKQSRGGFQPGNRAELDNLSDLLLKSLDLPKELTEQANTIERLKADLYERDTKIAALKQDMVTMVPGDTLIRAQAEIRNLEKRLEKYEKKEK